MTRIYGFSGWYTESYDINDWNQVIGESYWWSSTTQVGAYRAILWDNGVVSDLGTIGGVASVAYAINDLGHIVGTAQTASGATNAFLWTYVLPDPTPEVRIGAIIEQVDALVAGGWLNEGQGNALRSKLDSVLRHLDMGNAGAACSLFQAFVNQVDSLTHVDVLTAEQGQPLIDSADAASSELCP